MDIGFRIHKDSQVFDRVSAKYKGLTEFLIINECITSPSQSNDYSLLNLNFIKLKVHHPRVE
jgi:hypothetical protein